MRKNRQRPGLSLIASLLAASIHFILPLVARGQAEDSSGEIQPDRIQQSRNPALQTWEGDLVGQDSYEPGSYAQIEAVPNPGFAFEKWEGDTVQNPEEAKTIVSMRDHRQIKPVWKRLWNIIAQPDRKEAGSVEGGGVYPNGAEVTLSAEPNEGFKFLNWEGRGIRPEEKEELTTTIVADGNHNIVARFQNDDSQDQQDQQQDQDEQQDQQDQQEQEDQQDDQDQEEPEEQQDQDDRQEPDEPDPEEQDDREEPETEEENEQEDSPPEEPQVPPNEPQPVQMTLEEALRLLEAMEDDEKKLPLFIVQPPDPRTDPKKDW